MIFSNVKAKVLALRFQLISECLYLLHKSAASPNCLFLKVKKCFKRCHKLCAHH
uniref:Hypothetical secreted peptide n=1 Tax=Glossina morsitans morsitans TaxID=37546 RepID=D3TSM1_GLOMM